MARTRTSEALVPVVVLPPEPVEPLEALVQRKVNEALARTDGQLVSQAVEGMEGDDRLLEPWFRTHEEAFEIKRRQTVPEQKKWSVFFERYGCLYRDHKGDPFNRQHAGGGLCDYCRPRIADKLKTIVRELEKERER